MSDKLIISTAAVFMLTLITLILSGPIGTAMLKLTVAMIVLTLIVECLTTEEQ